MSLDGLRAWIGEVERKLGVRTKVMLALAAIAIGIGGAAMYLAIDTRESAVSEKDVQELQRVLEARIGAGGATTGVAQLESELDALQTEVDELKSGGGSDQGKGDTGGGASTGTGGAGTGGVTDKLRELSEGAQEPPK
jgi:hypothetical protein